MGKSNKNTTYAVLAIVVIVGLLFATGKLSMPAGSITTAPNTFSVTSNPSSTTSVAATTTGGPFLPSGSQLTVTPKHTDPLAASALTETTNVVTFLLNKVGTGYSLVTTGSGQVYTITSSDGSVYVGLQAASGQTYALDVNDFKAANPGRVVNMQYIDWQGSGTKMWVVQLNTNGLLSQAQLSGQKPDLTFNVPWYNVDAAVTVTAPSNISSIGTSGVDKHALVSITGTSKKAQLYKEIDIDFNSTSTSKWDEGLTAITTPFGVYNLNQATSKSVTGTDTIYYFKFANDQSTAPVVTIPASGNTVRYDDMKVHWTLSTNDKINIKTTYVTYSATDSAQSASGNWLNSA